MIYKKLFSLFIAFVFISTIINCKKSECKGIYTTIEDIPLLTYFLDCSQEDDSLLYLVLLALSVSSSKSSAAECPTQGSLSNPNLVTGSSITISGSDCTNSSIQSAIDSGGNITLDCSGNISITNALTVPTSTEVFITGQNGSGEDGKVILDGGNSSRILYGNSGSTIIVKNLQFQNGVSSSVGGEEKNAGGALFNGYKGVMTVIDCVFLNNTGGTTGDNSEEGGGAIYTKSFGKLTIVNSRFSNNTGALGGAINNLLSNLVIIDSTFSNNDSTVDTTSGAGYGGAIYTDGAGLGGVNGASNNASLDPPDGLGNITICRSVFSNNTAKGQGGGSFLFGYAPDVITLDEVIFSENSLSKNGIGDALGGGLRTGNADVFISNSTFVENVAKSQGGGLWHGEQGTVTISNSSFIRNFAVENGGTTASSLSTRTDSGGLCGGLNIASGNLDASQVTLVNNHAGFIGGAVCGDNLSFSKSIIAYNTAYNSGNEWKKGQNCTGTQPSNQGDNYEYPDKNSSDSSSDNITCFNSTIIDPGFESSSSFSYTNSVVSPVPLASLQDCSISIGESGNTSPLQTISLQSDSPAINSGANCP